VRWVTRLQVEVAGVLGPATYAAGRTPLYQSVSNTATDELI
jgi:hypothetical protein